MRRFIDDEHSDFYARMIKQLKQPDVYHRALIYTIGISDVTREHVRQIYDIGEREIRPECLEDSWQTGTTRKICLLAFNLFNGYTDHDDPRASTPEDLFACEYAPFFAHAIEMRYPEYH